MRVLCTGSRTWDRSDAVFRSLRAIATETFAIGGELTIVHGACPTGADAIVDRWARLAAAVSPRIRIERYPAKWSEGKGAGFARNKAMVDAGADLVLAFIRDGSRGASHTVRLAEEAGIPTKVIDYADLPEASDEH